MPDAASQPPPQAPAPVAAAETPKSSRLDSPWVLWPGTLALAAILYWGLGSLSDALTHETTDDAFIEANIIAIAPQVAGDVAKVDVLDNQFVRKSDPLLEIDSRDYDVRVAQKRASIRTSKANLQAVLGVLDLMTAKVTTAADTAKQAHAQAEASQATLVRSQADFKRAQELIKNKTISQQEYDAAEADVKKSEDTANADEQNAAADDSKVNEAKASLSASEAGVELARAQLQEAQTDIQSAELDQSYTKIFAPCDGRVTRKAVEAGDYVQVGQDLLAIVPVEVWVVANFKETQLAEMRTNQPAEIAIESIPGKTFHGHVDSFQSGSGARFSLLPPENAIGNYVKVVQRVPVKIVFNEPVSAEGVVGPGMSVLPSVHVKSYSIPRLVVLVLALVIAFFAMGAVKIAVARASNTGSAGNERHGSPTHQASYGSPGTTRGLSPSRSCPPPSWRCSTPPSPTSPSPTSRATCPPPPMKRPGC